MTTPTHLRAVPPTAPPATLRAFAARLLGGDVAAADNAERSTLDHAGEDLAALLDEHERITAELAAAPTVNVDTDPQGRIVVTVTGRGAPVTATLPADLSGRLAAEVIGRLAAAHALRAAGL